MKKILLTVLSLLFLGLSVNASTSVVRFNECGRPASVTTYGPGGMVTTNRIGTNGSTVGVPSYGRVYQRGGMQHIPSMPYRTHRPIVNNYNYNIETTKRASLSRLNRNYRVPKKSSYTRDGVTYYTYD